MNKLQRIIESTANVLIIAIALLLGVVIFERYVVSKPVENPPRIQPTLGSRVNLIDVNWSNHPKTLILALQTKCRFCNESADFYKRLIEVARNTNVNLVAVLPTSKEESTKHLQELGLTDLDVRQMPLNTLKVSGTPTLILTNERGEITNFWSGQLSSDKEMEVINQLR
jgi:hypothetical protein